MNVLYFPHSLDITSTSGSTLSTEEAHVVHNALLLLQGENHFKNIYFLGKIFGIENDYYLSFGYRRDAAGGRVFYYSINQRDWMLLSRPTPSAAKLTPKITRRFIGDPTHVLDLDGTEFGDTLSAGNECRLKEEDRLAATVNLLCDDGAIAPMRAFLQEVDGCVSTNPSFLGLNLEQGSDLHSWTHITKDKQSSSCSGDALDSIDRDLPSGCWCMRVRSQGSVCVVHNLYWLGLTAYHRLRTPEHGFVYFGDGIKNIQLVSMLDKPCQSLSGFSEK